MKSRQDGGSPDGKSQKVCQGGHRDRTACSRHCQTKTILERPLGVGGAEVVEALHGDEHVVDADAEEEEGDDVVEGPVGEATQAAESVGKTN